MILCLFGSIGTSSKEPSDQHTKTRTSLKGNIFSSYVFGYGRVVYIYLVSRLMCCL